MADHDVKPSEPAVIAQDEVIRALTARRDAGDVQPPAAGGAFELDRAIKRCVVWNTHARAGIDSVF